MNAFQACRNTSDAIPFYLPQQLYLKPCATINISVQLSPKIIGKTIVHGEIIQKLKALVVPDEFVRITVTLTTIEVVRFEAELELRSYVQRVLAKLDGKSIKLTDITPLVRVRADEAKSDFPSNHEWDAYFRDVKDMDEMKFGERPDTVHISHLPTQWFAAQANAQLPSEKLFYYAFEKFGAIRNVDIPICDPYRCKMKPHISGAPVAAFEDTTFFAGYVQFKDYLAFVDCMNALRGMTLMRRDQAGGAETVRIFVTFDKSKHLTEGAIRRRDILRERLVVKQRAKEVEEQVAQAAREQEESEKRQKNEELMCEKQQRRREREEKRKAKILAELKCNGKNDEIDEKIAKEERKLLKVQRRLEAIRLVEELFKRLESKLNVPSGKSAAINSPRKPNELKKMRLDYEQEVQNQREKLHHAIEGHFLLRSIVSTTTKEVCGKNVHTSCSSSEDSIGDPQRDAEKVYPSHPLNAINDWCHPYWHNPLLAYSATAPNFYHPRGGGPGYYFPSSRGRGFQGTSSSGQRRPFRNRGRGNYNRQHSSSTSSYPSRRYTRSRSRSRSKSKRYTYRNRSYSGSSRSRSSSKSRSRRRRRSYSSRSPSASSSRTPSRSKSKYTSRKSPDAEETNSYSRRSWSKVRSHSSHSK